MILNKHDQPADKTPWVTGDLFGLKIPADKDTLLSDGAGFLTRAFQAAGTLAPSNRISEIIEAREFFGGGTGKKLLLTVKYESADADLPTELFIKFSRNFENELWDRARYMMISEVRFAVLSRTKDFPVAVPRCLFADIEATSGTGLLITDCIHYGEGQVEPLYPKCMDYVVPDPVAHYATILTELARLSAAHCQGQLSPEFDRQFPYNPKQAGAMFALHAPLEKLQQRATRMFDFIERFPQLFPDTVRTPTLRQQFIADLTDVLAAESHLREVMFSNPDMIAFAHWNANIDNCWFWRDDTDQLHCGFIDWANAGPISMAQAVSGAISGAEPAIWDHHLDELLTVFIEEFATRGGPKLELDELRLHCLLIVIIGGVAYSMNAPIAIEREIGDLSGVDSYQHEVFKTHENARIQLHMMTKLLHLWQVRQLGEVVRQFL